MTDINKYNPYPHIAVVRCPGTTAKPCGRPAEFRKGIALLCKRTWQWWEPRLWPCARATDWEGKQRWAPGDLAPQWSGWIVVEQDPAVQRWKKPPQGYTVSDAGIVACPRCVGRRAHTLRWPRDAYYRFELPQGVIWAWNRDGAEALIKFIASTRRNPKNYGTHYLLLRHVPSVFLRAKDREQIVKRLRRDLAELE